MTTDELIRQLRWLSANLTLPVNGWVICRDAADELERLTNRVAEMEACLRTVKSECEWKRVCEVPGMIDAALEDRCK